MAAYLIKRLLLILPTMFGIMLISFCIIQFAPGGPVERVIAQREGVRNLRQSGLLKVKSGMTSLEEIEAVTNE